MSNLRIGVPSKGRLSEVAAELLKQAGLSFRRQERSLFARVGEMPVEITFLRTDDIPVLCAEGAIDMGITGGDLLGMLMAARDEDTGERMSRTQLRDEVMTFLLAGHETTAVALAWTWYLLARNPAIAERARAEVVACLGDRPPTLADLPQIPLARMVVEEAMRLYPPVWGIGRETIAADRIGDWVIPARTLVNLSPWVTHRHPDVWPDPDRFDPERFRPGVERPRPRFAYFPFSGGPRLCIGEQFALMEMQLVVALVLQRWRLTLLEDRTIDPEPTLTLRPRGAPAHDCPRRRMCSAARTARPL
jgi:cytochrome P450